MRVCINFLTRVRMPLLRAHALAYQMPIPDISSKHFRKSEQMLAPSLIDVEPLGESTTSKITKWISSCHNRHEACRKDIQTAYPLPTRVIDVGPGNAAYQPHLMNSAGMCGEYITLSHRWGGSVTLTTIESTYQEHLTRIDFDAMPRNFQDAVTITKKLGKRYLWIDSLCIIQDSTDDWACESVKMGSYYGNAWLTLSADGEMNSQGGMLKERNLLEIRMCRHPTLIRVEGVHDCAWNVYYPIGSFKEVVHDGILSKRAWILQERVLSGRMLHWGAHEVFWECAQLQASERRPKGVQKNLWNGHHLVPFLNGVMNSSASIPTMDEGASKRTINRPVFEQRPKILEDVYDFWYELVDDYCKRNLTQPKDKLPAMGGLAEAFQRLLRTRYPTLNHEYIAGIWASDLIIGLGWPGAVASIVPQPPQKGPITYAVQHRVFSENCAPSFSWASIDGPVTHHYLERVKAGCRIEGSEAEVLGYDVAPELSSPFGRVKSARIYLRGFFKKFQAPTKHVDLYLDGVGRFLREDLESYQHLYCFCLGFVTHERSNPFAFCLALVPNGSEPGVYRRVGLVYRLESPWFTDCERRTIQIV